MHVNVLYLYQLVCTTIASNFLNTFENGHKPVNKNHDFQKQDLVKLNEDGEASNAGLAGTLYNCFSIFFFIIYQISK